jgi:hypothetical protein
MPVTRQRTLDYVEYEWGTYVERSRSLPEAEQIRRVQAMGYDSLRDLLAHVLAWWQEGMEIISAIAEGREYPRKKYDFDAFNAEAVAHYTPWDEAAFMAYFEQTRQGMVRDLRSMNEAVFENRRARNWLNGIVVVHAREHLLTLSRFLAMDVLDNEWAGYVPAFKSMEQEGQKQFLSKQGFESFHALLAHILGWWEDGLRAVKSLLEQPGFTWTEPDTDSFNRELVRKYSTWTDDELFAHYEAVRLALIDLVTGLPEDAFQNKDIESWLAADVVEHYDEHALPQ